MLRRRLTTEGDLPLSLQQMLGKVWKHKQKAEPDDAQAADDR